MTIWHKPPITTGLPTEIGYCHHIVFCHPPLLRATKAIDSHRYLSVFIYSRRCERYVLTDNQSTFYNGASLDNRTAQSMPPLFFDNLQCPALRDSLLCSAISDDQFRQLKKHSHRLTLEAGQIIFQQGMDLTHIYFVEQGAIKLSRCTLQGDEKIIEVITPGKSFAEGVLFTCAPRYPVTATAVKPSTIIAISASHYLNILSADTTLCLRMLGHLSQRLHWMLKELDKQTLHNASFRIVDYFVALADESSARDEETFDLCLNIPKRDIASRLSIKPETFSRALKQLADRDLIELVDNHIILKDIPSLRRMLELEEI